MILYTFAVDGVEAPKSTKLPLKLQPYAGLLALLLIYLTLATIYLSIVPPLEGFDAMAHMNAINYWREEQRLPVVDLATNQYSYELLTQPPLYYMLSAAALRWLPADDAATFVRASANRYFPGLSTRQSIDLPTLPRTVAWALFIARLISLLGGTVAVIATWLWVRVALPDQQWLPFAVSAVMVGNPLFLFISTSITNDGWAAAGTVVVIYLVTCLAADPPRSLVPWFFAGVVAGLAALTKYSVLLVAVPALVILLQYRCYRPLPRFLAISVALFAGALLTAGWWYGRNLLLYGQPVPLERVSAVITTLERPTLMTPTEVWELLPFLFYSYWGLFVATFAPARFFAVIQWAVLVALIGLPVGLSRWRHQREATRVLWLALIWFVLNLVSMINYMRLISYGEQARFFLTAAPAIALLLVFGWQAWLPARFVPRLRLLLLPAFVLLALWPLSTLRTAYRQPSTTAADEVSRPVNVHFQGGMTVVGYSLPAGGALVADQTLPLTLYLTTNHPIAGDYTLFLQLVDSEDRLLYQYDGVPAKGRHPTRQWQPGRLFADPYALTVTAPVRTDTVATLLMGFYEYESPTARLPLFDATGRPIGDRLILGEIRLLAELPPRANGAANPMARWAGGPDLLDAVVTQRDAEHYTVDLTWRTTALLPTDYTVFVQFLDTNDRVVAQHDQEPRNGQAPTSTWLTNERIRDTVEVHVPGAWSRVIVGLYNAQTGERLP
ncbi:MAG: hypothetical protein KDE53_37995, partial [Caldilineaceae bacterium]|nr:hypothetical protein [Caldilineaceae bacterium]